jgi:hypothetical protein
LTTVSTRSNGSFHSTSQGRLETGPRSEPSESSLGLRLRSCHEARKTLELLHPGGQHFVVQPVCEPACPELYESRNGPRHSAGRWWEWVRGRKYHSPWPNTFLLVYAPIARTFDPPAWSRQRSTRRCYRVKPGRTPLQAVKVKT